ncbi:hypothetical protein EDD86DRAFT_4159 [Gorgonomyces haynaldii]|nr:hypothetical protein EDD86DRAFT_4159 [Gorgonomyces haynaldii]
MRFEQSNDSFWNRTRSHCLPSIKMAPFPHTSTQFVQKTDRDLELLRKLSLRRRSSEPRQSLVVVRDGPPPDVLSKHFSRKPVLPVLRGAHLLPPPSFCNPLVEEEVEERPKRRYQRPEKTPELPLLHPSKVLAHRYDSSLSQEVEHLLIQRPVVIYMQQKRPKPEHKA